MINSDVVLENLRSNRLKSYQATPGDIEEHRRAELRVAGDTAGRPLIELIQNADDAMNQTSDSDNNRIKIILQNDRLLVANHGTPFTPEGVEAICNLDRSPKKDRRVTIGNKGIGFKSVLSWSMKPTIYSTTFEFTFDREKSAKEITQALKEDYQTEHMPLMRLPFKTSHRNDLIDQLYQDGFVTVIILPLKNETVSMTILGELDNFDPLTLLFLNSVSHLLIITDDFERQYHIFREKSQTRIKVNDGEPECYKIFRNEKKIPEPISSTLPEGCRDLTHGAISIAIPETPFEGYYQLFSYFPTSEMCPFKFFMHGDFILDAGRKHLRGDAEKYNEWIMKEMASLFVKETMPYFGKNNPTVLDFLECRSPDAMEPVERQIFDAFEDVIGETEFLPAMLNPSRLMYPQIAGLAKEETISDINSLFENEIEWGNRFLIGPKWTSETRLETLKKFGGKEIKKPDFVKILGFLARPDPNWCTTALNIILKWISEAPSRSLSHESASDIANALKKQDLFLTTKLKLRSISSDTLPPLFLLPAGGKTIEIPSFISLDFLNPELGKDLEKVELTMLREGLKKLSQYGLHPFRPHEIIEKAVLPAIETADESIKSDLAYNKDLLIFLAQLEISDKFEDMDPYPWFNDLRTQLAHNICVPIENGDWLPAWKVYATEEWVAPDELRQVYGGSPNQGFLTSPDDAVHSGIPVQKWKAMYRYLGVSWEPKILPIEEVPEYISQYSFSNPHPSHVSEEDWKLYKSYYIDNKSLSVMWRWTIKLEESFALDGWNNVSKDAEKSMNLLQLLYNTEAFIYIVGHQKEKVKCSFRYTKISSSYYASCDSFLIWGIKHSNWLPTRRGRLLPPDKIFLEDSEIGKGLKGIVPVLQIKRPKGKELVRRFEDLIDEIGIRTNWDQITIEDWSNWLNELCETKTDISKEKAMIAQTLYRLCLEQCQVSENTNPFSDINVLSLSSDNQYSYRKAKEVVYSDEPRFDTIKKKLMDSGYNIFSVELGGENRAKKAKDLFGMTLASEMINEEVIPGGKVNKETEKWQKNFESLAPVLLSRLSMDRPASRTKDQEFFRSLKILAVTNLKKKFKLLNTEELLFEEEPSVCWASSDYTLYMNTNSSERNLWSGLAESLAQRLGQTYCEAFENLLLCESDSERIEKLRRAGVPEDDVLYCASILKEELPFSTDDLEDTKGYEIKEEEPVDKKPADEEIIEGTQEEPVGNQILGMSNGEFGKEFQEKSTRGVYESETGPEVNTHGIGAGKHGVDTPPQKPGKQEKKEEIELAAMNWVERYEKRNKRTYKDVSRYNLGYDIESDNPLTGKKRYIEVKGAWGRPEKREVTINEWRTATELRDNYYIYYVLGLGDEEGEIRIINNPAGKIKPDVKTFDISLPRELADKIISIKKKE
ncbi:MAG: DUF3883 domain-containing protein [Thermodesulfobacteriota bacterium]|nr:DUF3883 domain-containing protein [Thermodesulfobacteriota bacterium]